LAVKKDWCCFYNCNYCTCTPFITDVSGPRGQRNIFRRWTQNTWRLRNNRLPIFCACAYM